MYIVTERADLREEGGAEKEELEVVVVVVVLLLLLLHVWYQHLSANDSDSISKNLDAGIRQCELEIAGPLGNLDAAQRSSSWW